MAQITPYQNKLERILLNYSIGEISEFPYDEQVARLREFYTPEDFVFDYKRIPQELAYDALVTYLTYKTYQKIEQYLSVMPIKEEKVFLNMVYYLTDSEFFNINKVNGYLSQAPELVVRDVVAKIKRDITSKWYAKYKTIKVTKVDPKGLDRVAKIHEAYNKVIIANRKHTLGTGSLFNKETYIIFRSPKRDEILAVYLYDCRGVTGNTVSAEKDTPVVFEKKGSVTGTTLKEVKEAVKIFANQSKDTIYWKAVASLIDNNL